MAWCTAESQLLVLPTTAYGADTSLKRIASLTFASVGRTTRDALAARGFLVSDFRAATTSSGDGGESFVVIRGGLRGWVCNKLMRDLLIEHVRERHRKSYFYYVSSLLTTTVDAPPNADVLRFAQGGRVQPGSSAVGVAARREALTAPYNGLCGSFIVARGRPGLFSALRDQLSKEYVCDAMDTAEFSNVLSACGLEQGKYAGASFLLCSCQTESGTNWWESRKCSVGFGAAQGVYAFSRNKRCGDIAVKQRERMSRKSRSKRARVKSSSAAPEEAQVESVCV